MLGFEFLVSVVVGLHLGLVFVFVRLVLGLGVRVEFGLIWV